MRHKRKLTMGFVVLLAISVIGAVAYYRARPKSEKTILEEHRAFWVRISDQEAIEYSWQQRMTFYPWQSYIEYDGYLTWQIYGESRRFFVGVDSFIPESLEMHTDDKGHLWLVQSPINDVEKAGILATLDRKTGEFINSFGTAIDWHLSPQKQEALERPRIDNTGDTKLKPFPAWAGMNKGKVLVHTGNTVLFLPDRK